MITFAVAAPLVGAIAATIVRYRPVRRPLRALFAGVAVVLALLAIPELDRLSGLFVVVISVLSLLATLYSLSIFPGSLYETERWAGRPVYCILLGAFSSSMLAAVASTTFIGLWIGISATTLATTFLVGFSGGKAALEAAWKYLVLCSFGIAIALIGILLLGRAGMAAHIPSDGALSWDTLSTHGGQLSPALVRVALVLMLLGFGTKAGLVPMHSWLPDAHSKAPAPISALLSGLLVSCALYAIVRVQQVAAYTAPALFNEILLCFGSLSILVAATLMLAQRDVKRLLSYSTIEHAGLVAIALGLGTPLGTFAGLYHIVNHAFTKSLAFFAVGIVQHERGTTTVGKLRGLWNDPSGKLLLAALVALMGLPPFGIFLSEMLIIVAAASAHQWIALAFALSGLLVAFMALVRLAIETESGHRVPRMPGKRQPILAFASVGATVVAAVLLALVPFVMSSSGNAALSVALRRH